MIGHIAHRTWPVHHQFPTGKIVSICFLWTPFAGSDAWLMLQTTTECGPGPDGDGFLRVVS